MSRLIDIDPGVEDWPAQLIVDPGDVLRFSATGGHVKQGTSLELVGILTDGVVGTDGQVLTPMGAPGTVMFRATHSGSSVIDVVTGDPWRSPVTRNLKVIVT